MLYYTAPGSIPQVVFGQNTYSHKNFGIRQITANFIPACGYTRRQRATAPVRIPHRPACFVNGRTACQALSGT